MKKRTLLSLVAGFLLIPSTALAFELPKRFEKYYEKEVIIKELTMFPTGLGYLKAYDINGNKKADASEIYRVLRIFKNARGNFSAIMRRNPFSYAFDLNKDNKLTDNEIFLDIAEDGWNGNEERIDLYVDKIKI